MNRSGLVLIGAAVAVVGYALVYSGMSQLNPCITPAGVPVSTVSALIPGTIPTTPSRRQLAKDPTPGPAPGR